MGRRPRAIMPLTAEVTTTRTEALDVSVPPLASPLAAVPPETAPAQPERSRARQVLADAIAEVRALEIESAEAGAAVSEADSARWAAESVLTAAEEALERARPRPGFNAPRPREPHTFRSQEEADAYTVLLNTPPPSIEDAKAAVASATDARDSALAALQFHQKRLDQATQRLSWKRSSIGRAADLAVHYDPAMAALAAETKKLVTLAAAAERAFSLATGGALLQRDNPYHGATAPTDFRTDPEGWALLHRWREALAALQSDPDAVLPMPDE
ncbi:hypothetical protein D3273_27025 [Lichenibacterium minor]|uniref:Uncharacterized protein n=1 Tax=Lichenibacterium minor TaxID=2316528 RepID=A0A4Q2TXQ8_9HYPH|nr:hypothetical protein [Lichenibacterium minor]RYC28863.1 hypothetical protein D3273_27025 [Lichenibacterium minor]